ncbi:transcription factor PAP1-domain-containing protein [Diplogelasinospora grovesii]|uniref:Transcription factor PAP1-domain-containing protein n=1 Tax=Diplogelasinospora grovesii TaxID=303347 RepID=A0AAN6N9H0_9PEZI|nr:transcription factor PAP1-domain-containing protein [Diplogelasinospora grovesii]
MTSTARNPLDGFVLTPQQQNLLFAALNSNKTSSSTTPSSNALANFSPSTFNGSPTQGTDGGVNGLQDSPYLNDYDYDFGGPDSSFDFAFDEGNPNQPKMIGDLPGTGVASSAASKSGESTTDNGDSPDKRSHPDDDDESELSPKRREGEDKVAKKPGRKPLTTEPSSKRKAQNRAAQRAFRERKEKHLKDLETKVQELEHASKAANNENELLRAKVEKMTVELNEYKKRVSLLASGRTTMQGLPKPFGAPFVNNINDVNFQFEFPKFGALPGPPTVGNNNNNSNANANTNGNGVKSSQSSKRNSNDQLSPMDKSNSGDNAVSRNNSSSYSQIGLDSQAKEDLANLSAGLFTPPLTNGNAVNGSRSSMDSHFSMGGATTTSSPSASSNSNMGGPSSSCGTSPEPFTQSPMGFKPVDTLTTIGEEQPSLHSSTQGENFIDMQTFETSGSVYHLGHFPSVDVNDFNWLPQTNFQFDPQLFGDYREPQESILSNGFDDSFFNDALDMDFPTPYNLPLTAGSAVSNKKDLISQIDEAKNSDDVSSTGQLLTCNKIWYGQGLPLGVNMIGDGAPLANDSRAYRERLQNCPKVQNGDFDLDGLCSDLQKKAKCSGSGAVVDEKDFKTVMKKYLGKTDKELAACDFNSDSAFC